MKNTIVPIVNILKRKLDKNKEYLFVFGYKNGLIKYIETFTGETDKITMPIEKIILSAKYHKCEQIVIAHNHLSGYIIPSEQDAKSFVAIKRAAKEIGIELIDSIIIAGDDCYSVIDNK
jgi:DNA repair protein RadC